MKVWDKAGIQVATPGSAVRLASVAIQVTDCATRPGHYEWDLECICIVINGKTCSVPLNILGSVSVKLSQVFFVFLFDSLRSTQQSFSYVGTGFPGLNQY